MFRFVVILAGRDFIQWFCTNFLRSFPRIVRDYPKLGQENVQSRSPTHIIHITTIKLNKLAVANQYWNYEWNANLCAFNTSISYFILLNFKLYVIKSIVAPLYSLGLCFDALKIPSYSNEFLMLFFFKYSWSIWCGFDRASSLICGNKMPTRCNRGSYCRSYCLLNLFRAPLCTSSGAQEYYTMVAACGISCCGFQVVGLVCSWGLCVRFAGCKPDRTLISTPNQQLENHSTKYHRQQPLYKTLKLLMMGIVMPETCWASSKICNKNLCCI